MTTKKPKESDDDASRGILDDAASLDTTGIGILTNTAQVSVVLPHDADDELDDDAVIEGEVVEIVLDEVPVAGGEAVAAIDSIVIELPAEEAVEPVAETEEPAESPETADARADAMTAAPAIPEAVSEVAEAGLEEPEAGAEVEPESEGEPEAEVDPEPEAQPEPDPEIVIPVADAAEAPTSVTITARVDETAEAAELADAEERAAAAAFVARAKAELDAAVVAQASAAPSRASEPQPTTDAVPTASGSPAPGTGPVRIRSRQGQASAAVVPVGGLPRADAVKEKATSTQRRAQEPELVSKRLGELGDASRESADLLTAERLLDPSRLTKPEPEGAWSHLLYTLSGRRINIGDGRRARERKALSARIAAPLPGGACFVPVLSRKGGVGKTAVTALLGMALADAREDRVIAVDANPDRGTLADRVARGHHTRSVRDLVRIRDEVRGYHDLSAIVARDATRLDVLASDSDPRIAEAFSDSDYRDVAHVAAHYYSLVLTDTGTGIVHSVMAATLDLADQIVIVSGLSVDEARLASETLTWLEANGYSEQAHDAIVVLNQSTPGTPLVRLNELEAHFATRARKVVRMPYDPQIAGGGTIEFAALQPETRIAARELAAQLVEGLRTKVA